MKYMILLAVLFAACSSKKSIKPLPPRGKKVFVITLTKDSALIGATPYKVPMAITNFDSVKGDYVTKVDYLYGFWLQDTVRDDKGGYKLVEGNMLDTLPRRYVHEVLDYDSLMKRVRFNISGTP